MCGRAPKNAKKNDEKNSVIHESTKRRHKQLTSALLLSEYTAIVTHISGNGTNGRSVDFRTWNKWLIGEKEHIKTHIDN